MLSPTSRNWVTYPDYTDAADCVISVIWLSAAFLRLAMVYDVSDVWQTDDLMPVVKELQSKRENFNETFSQQCWHHEPSHVAGVTLRCVAPVTECNDTETGIYWSNQLYSSTKHSIAPLKITNNTPTHTDTEKKKRSHSIIGLHANSSGPHYCDWQTLHNKFSCKLDL